MDSALWPATVPEILRTAAGELLAEQDPSTVIERLRSSLGIDQFLRLDDPDTICARDAALRDSNEFERLALTIGLSVGHQLLHQYPSSSLLWDALVEDLCSVFDTFDFDQVATGVWNGNAEAGRTIVVELREEVSMQPDERRFTLRWGIVLPAVPFCRHDGPHQLSCCAIAGGMGSVREPHGDHQFVLTLGMVLERLAGAPVRLVGEQGFKARIHRLCSFCERVADRERLAQLVSGHHWRSGIGVAERLRNADPDELGELLS